tara:strand:- start:63029 stop:63442 length:414 start_codon:yes stop_codon:yes gene_type:complete
MKIMGVISKDNNKITLYYNSKNSIGKQCYAYVQASEKKVLGVDLSKTKVTGTQWSELAENLNIPIKDLIDVNHADFVREYGSDKVDMEPNDWLKILEKKPKLVQFPILIFGTSFYQLKSGADFKKYLGASSAGIEKS